VRFRLQTDYALKAILYLAMKGDANSTTEEIAEFYDISAAHLGRVIRRLQRYGYVKAIRGRRGGVRLDRDPSGLTLGEIVETLEEGGSLAEPNPGETPEARVQASQMRATLRRARGLFSNYLDKVSLTSLVERSQATTGPGDGAGTLPSDAAEPSAKDDTVVPEPTYAGTPERPLSRDD